MFFDDATRNLVLQTRNDPPYTWRIAGTSIIFDRTAYDVLNAFYELNKQLLLVGCASIEDFLSFLEVSSRGWPENELNYGWVMDCFNYCGDGVWIDPWISHTIERDRIIFDINFQIGPCEGALSCMGFSEECDLFSNSA